MSLEFKKRIVLKIIESLEAEMRVMLSAANEAREAATHEESIAEDKYDTRGLEASYLAGAQAKRANELQLIIQGIQNLELIEIPKASAINKTAVVELNINSNKAMFFIVPKSGGLTLLLDKLQIQTLTPESRLGAELMGKHVGESFELKIANKVNEYEILNIF